MKVNHNTQIDFDTRQELLGFCKQTGKSIAQVTNEALIDYLRKQGVEAHVPEPLCNEKE